jgi:hypothetical protein
MFAERCQDFANRVGYVGEDDPRLKNRGGWFFTWFPTLAETLASIEVDTTDRPVRLRRAAVEREVRRLWKSERRKIGHYSMIPGQSWDESKVRSSRYPMSRVCE